MEEISQIRLTGMESEGVTLCIQPSDDPAPYHALMLKVRVKANLKCFTADVENSILTREFTTFHSNLETLYEELEGTASFTTFAEWLGIDVTVKRHGIIEISGFIAHQTLYTRNILDFQLTDMVPSDLKRILDQFRNVSDFYGLDS